MRGLEEIEGIWQNRCLPSRISIHLRAGTFWATYVECSILHSAVFTLGQTGARSRRTVDHSCTEEGRFVVFLLVSLLPQRTGKWVCWFVALSLLRQSTSEVI
jgi:hypothetical protein